MNPRKRNAAFLAVPAVMILIAGIIPRLTARAKAPSQNSSTNAADTTQAKIALAMSAGPPDIANSAKIIDKDALGHTIVLREGTNGFTCMPGNPNVVGDPAMCADGPSMQWAADFSAHKPKPTNTVPGITYMLAGATQRSDSDPYDKTSPAITVGPHWMIMWPFDPKTTGLPTTHKDTGAYIMWAGSPYAHMHIMGHP
jgi:hypothetical protein